MRTLPGALAVFAALLASGAPARTWAQVVPPTPPAEQRVPRFLPVARAAFVDAWEPSPAVGALYQLSLGRSRTVLEEGIPVTRGPVTYLHALAAGGLSYVRGEGWGPRGFGELGVVRRTNGTMTAWGAVAHGVTGPWGAGPAVRVELLDNLGFVAGWTVAGEREARGPFLSVDVSPGVLQLLF